MKTCRHCQAARVGRPRGLCWRCYYRPDVRELYQSTSKYARRSTPDYCGRARLPGFPTDAAPGSEAKVAVLEERAARREALWHPMDKI